MCTSGIMYEFEDEQIEDCRIQKDIEASMVEDLEGWGFDMERLRESEGGRLSLDRRSPRAFSTNVSNDPTQPKDILSEDEWCAYGGLPSPKAYM